MTTNVYTIESPCEDSYYGFQLDLVCDSFDKALEKLKEISRLDKHIHPPVSKHNINKYTVCYKPSIYNVKELVLNEHSFNESLMNDIFICFCFDDNMKLIYKDVDDIYGSGIKFYSTLEKIDANNYSLNFIEEDKTILLHLNSETNMLSEIDNNSK